MRRAAIFIFALAAAVCLPQKSAAGLFGFGSADTSFVDKASVELEKRLAKSSAVILKNFYKEMFYTPVWVSKKKPTAFAKTLIKRVMSDKTIAPDLKCCENVRDLKKALDELYSSGNASFDRKIDMELRLSRLYLGYMRYLLYGGIDWGKFDEKRRALAKHFDSVVGWEHYRPKMTPASLLTDAIMKGDLKSAFNEAEPKRFKYAKMKKYLIRYMELADNGGWEKLPPFKLIKPGQSSKAIPVIRRHLAIEGDLGSCRGDMSSQVYDECLQSAVKKFKLRHGLHGNAVINADTRRALSIPIEKKIRMLRLNMDRIKWLWREEAKVRIELNIPAFRLYFYDGRHLVDTMRVIVGKPNHPTPSFHDIMEYLIVNPYWKIPESIVKKEMLGHLIADPYYYERRGKILRSSWDESSPRVDPGSVNWSQYRGKKPIPYYFMQLPSSRNALGKIKFLFPNKFSVYIHDTPTKKLFFKNQRAFSHGCMRIQKPREMLKALSLYNDNIDVEEIMSLLTTTRKKTIVLKQKVPVDIVYLTAFVDDYGYLNFRRDVYKYDKYQFDHYAYGTYPVGSEKRASREETELPGKNKQPEKHSAENSGKNNVDTGGSSRNASSLKKEETEKREEPVKKKETSSVKVKKEDKSADQSKTVAPGKDSDTPQRQKRTYTLPEQSSSVKKSAGRDLTADSGKSEEPEKKKESGGSVSADKVPEKKESNTSSKSSAPGRVDGVKIINMTKKTTPDNIKKKPVMVIETKERRSGEVEVHTASPEKQAPETGAVPEKKTEKVTKAADTQSSANEQRKKEDSVPDGNLQTGQKQKIEPVSKESNETELKKLREEKEKRIKQLMENLDIK